MSYIAHYYHIVFRTFRSEPSIPDNAKRIMFSYIYKMMIGRGWTLIRINGYRDHIHLLVGLPATVRICDVVALLKSQTSKTFRGHPQFPAFRGWAGRYASLTMSYYEVATIKNYIINQEKHHADQSMRGEITELFKRHGITADDFFEDTSGLTLASE